MTERIVALCRHWRIRRAFCFVVVALLRDVALALAALSRCHFHRPRGCGLYAVILFLSAELIAFVRGLGGLRSPRWRGFISGGFRPLSIRSAACLGLVLLCIYILRQRPLRACAQSQS